jgi:predicted nucleic acid-binding protein
MSHLLDTDICSAHFRRPSGLAHRFFQYGGGLYVSTVVLGELYSGAHHASDPALLKKIADLLIDVHVLDFDRKCAERFGKVRGSLL